MSDLQQSSQAAAKKIKVTLTGRPAVKIDPDNWPVLASAADKEFDSQYEFQANRTSTWKLIVRQHERGCALVYGIYTYDSRCPGEKCHDIRGGRRLSPGANLVRAIFEVAEWMESHGGGDTFGRLANECIGDLPAEDCECDGSELAVIV